MSLSHHSSAGEVRSRLQQRTEITVITNEAGDKTGTMLLTWLSKAQLWQPKGKYALLCCPALLPQNDKIKFLVTAAFCFLSWSFFWLHQNSLRTKCFLVCHGCPTGIREKSTESSGMWFWLLTVGQYRPKTASAMLIATPALSYENVACLRALRVGLLVHSGQVWPQMMQAEKAGQLSSAQLVLGLDWQHYGRAIMLPDSNPSLHGCSTLCAN